MIIPKLYGRLGNQCFQISAAIAHAKAVGATWRVPYRTADPRVWPTYFPLPVARGAATVHMYTEKRHCYDPLPMYRDLMIDGYFQSEKYFEHAKPEVQIALNMHCQKDDFVAIHVRRGDFVTQFPDKHPPLQIDYYNAAIDFFLEQGFERFKVYSDDIAWCRSDFKPMFQWAHVGYSEWLSNPVWDMADMYNAGAFIIANSTFSLFPALLRDDNPLVIAPAENRWYGPGNAHLETFDLMAERFIKI